MKNMFPFLAIMTAASTDLATGGGATPAPATPAKKKQHTITVREDDKATLNLIQGEFYGPQASDPEQPRYLSTEEGFAVILAVASAHRFGPATEMTQAVDENLQPVYDTDGAPVMVETLVDNFATEANKLIEARGIRAKSTKLSALQEQIAKLQAELAATKAAKGAVEEVEG